MFGGGGHIKAAGATINLPLEEAKKAIVAETMKFLKWWDIIIKIRMMVWIR